jgi:hypothetical protein
MSGLIGPLDNIWLSLDDVRGIFEAAGAAAGGHVPSQILITQGMDFFFNMYIAPGMEYEYVVEEDPDIGYWNVNAADGFNRLTMSYHIIDSGEYYLATFYKHGDHGWGAEE